MSFQTTLQIIAMISVVTCLAVIVVSALRLGAEDIGDLWHKINRQPVAGRIMRVALPLALASILLEAVIRVGGMF